MFPIKWYIRGIDFDSLRSDCMDKRELRKWTAYILALVVLAVSFLWLLGRVENLQDDRDRLLAELEVLKKANDGLSKMIAPIEDRVSRLENFKNPELPK